MAADRESRIRDKAHAFWEEGGRQEGHHERDWSRAVAAIDAESAVTPPKRRASAAKSPGAKPVEKDEIKNAPPTVSAARRSLSPKAAPRKAAPKP